MPQFSQRIEDTPAAARRHFSRVHQDCILACTERSQNRARDHSRDRVAVRAQSLKNEQRCKTAQSVCSRTEILDKHSSSHEQRFKQESEKARKKNYHKKVSPARVDNQLGARVHVGTHFSQRTNQADGQSSAKRCFT